MMAVTSSSEKVSDYNEVRRRTHDIKNLAISSHHDTTGPVSHAHRPRPLPPVALWQQKIGQLY